MNKHHLLQSLKKISIEICRECPKSSICENPNSCWKHKLLNLLRDITLGE